MPPRRVSTLVSLFEQPIADPRSPTNSSISSIPISARFVRPGAVSEHVRRFSASSGDAAKASTSNSEQDSVNSVKPATTSATNPTSSNVASQDTPRPPSATTNPAHIQYSNFKPRRIAPSAPVAPPAIMAPAHVRVKNRVDVMKPGRGGKENPIEKVIQEIKSEGGAADLRLKEVEDAITIDGGKESVVMDSPLSLSATPTSNPFESLYDGPDSASSSHPATSYPPRPLARPGQSSTSISFASTVSSSKYSKLSTARSSLSSISTRPLLLKSPSSSNMSTKTVRLAAATVFNKNSAPLVLPHLDAYLDALPKPNFTPIDQKGLLSTSEARVWREWTRIERESEREHWYSGWFKAKKYVDVEKQKFVNSDKNLIFPPMNLIAGTNLSDLRENKTVPLFTSDTVYGILIDAILGGEGSNYGLSLTQIESFRDAVQVLSLLARKVEPGNTSTRSGVLAFLAGDFATAFGYALVWLFFFSAIALFAVYEIYRFSGGWQGIQEVESEGLDQESHCIPCKTGWRDGTRYKTAITFIATTLYLPLSKLALDGLVWSRDYWESTLVIAQSSDPSAAIDFCYRTNFDSSHFHLAYIIILFSSLIFFILSIFLPYRLYQIAEASAPKIDNFTSLGTKRKDKDRVLLYSRLLEKDRGAFSFLYNAYRRPYAAFKAVYLVIKLSTVIIVVIFSEDNCVFYQKSATVVGLFRQSFILLFTSIFFLVKTDPFISSITNSSDNLSRFSFVVVAFFGLVAILAPGAANIVNGSLTMTVVILVYLFNIYFAIVSFDYSQLVIQKLQKRVNLSLDIFSPALDLKREIGRRIWRETFSVILLASEEFRMQADRVLKFKDLAGTPYLVAFGGSQAERLVENIQILRQIGLDTYVEAYQPVDEQTLKFRKRILRDFTGPDIAWSGPPSLPPGVSSIFGRLDVSPFPFVCIFRYDQAPLLEIELSSKAELHHLIHLNDSVDIRERVKLRRSLRALENEIIYAPTSILLDDSGAAVRYEYGTVRIKRNVNCLWRNYNYGSGFEVSVSYKKAGEKNVVQSGYDLGLSDDFRSNHASERLFKQNRKLLDSKIGQTLALLESHRHFFSNEMEWKENTLSYSLSPFVNETLSKLEIVKMLEREKALKVQKLVENHSAAMEYLFERMEMVENRRVENVWWYLLWDEIWRRNADLGLPLKLSPYYRDSIAYQLMSRSRLEAFLREENLTQYFDSGFLNKVYFYLDEIIFANTSEAIPIQLNDEKVAFGDLPDQIMNVSHLSTSAGTDLDDSTQRLREAFNFEELFRPQENWWKSKILVWLGLKPIQYSFEDRGITFDLRRRKSEDGAGWEIPRLVK